MSLRKPGFAHDIRTLLPHKNGARVNADLPHHSAISLGGLNQKTITNRAIAPPARMTPDTVTLINPGITAPTPAILWLVVARGLQEIGAALLVPGSLALISAGFPPALRGRAIGIWAGFSAMTAAIGPVLGGWWTTLRGDGFSSSIFLLRSPS